MKVWMLTGDKLETVQNIALSCNLIDGSFKVLTVTDDRVNSEEAAMLELDQYKKKDIPDSRQSGQKVCLCIEGGALSQALRLEGIGEEKDSTLKYIQQDGPFMKLIRDCDAVICCRCKPNHKQQVVRLVKRKGGKDSVSLSIGDGANDVAMINEAEIGIGIIGKEGVQAVLASDYAIAQFRFLTQLMFVHGRWDYQRMCLLIKYTLYKNAAFAPVQWLYQFPWAAFSAVPFWIQYYQTLWNILFTFGSIVAVAFFRKDFIHQPTLHR